MSDEVKVKVSHMTKKFGDLTVLNDISFDVKKGEFLCVVETSRMWKNNVSKLSDQVKCLRADNRRNPLKWRAG